MDPVSGRSLAADEVYARADGLVFESLQTQQIYYKTLERGFVVAWDGGRPSLVEKNTASVVWQLVTRDGAFAQIPHFQAARRVLRDES